MRLVELPTINPITIDLNKMTHIKVVKGERILPKRKCRIRNGKPKISMDEWSIWMEPKVIIFLQNNTFTISMKSNDSAKEFYNDLVHLWLTKPENDTITTQDYFR